MNLSADINRREGNDQESIRLPNSFRSKTPKGKTEALKIIALQSNHYKQKAKRTVYSPKNVQTAIQNKKNHQDIHAKTYNDRISKPQQKHRHGTASKLLLGVGGGMGVEVEGRA